MLFHRRGFCGFARLFVTFICFIESIKLVLENALQKIPSNYSYCEISDEARKAGLICKVSHTVTAVLFTFSRHLPL